MISWPLHQLFFFFNDTATTEIYTLSLHDALPIWATMSEKMLLTKVEALREYIQSKGWSISAEKEIAHGYQLVVTDGAKDRKSTRLNSSHTVISYAVFCLKKKKRTRHPARPAKHPS